MLSSPYRSQCPNHLRQAIPTRVAIRPLTTIPYLFQKVHLQQLTGYDAGATTCSAGRNKHRIKWFKASAINCTPSHYSMFILIS